MNEEIDHECTDEIVCPWCGSIWQDSHEVEPNEEYLSPQYCEDCDKWFYASRYVRVSYDTYKVTYGTCEHCGKEDTFIQDCNSTCAKFKNACLDCYPKLERQGKEKYFKMFEENVD